MKKLVFFFAILIHIGFGGFKNLSAQDDLIRTIGLGTLECIAYSPDGTKLASVGSKLSIYIWDIYTGEVIDTLKGGTSRVISLAFSPDGKMLACGFGYEDNAIRIWNLVNGKLLKTLYGHTARVNSVIFSPDGKMLASGSDDGTIKLWNVDDGMLLRTFNLKKA